MVSIDSSCGGFSFLVVTVVIFFFFRLLLVIVPPYNLVIEKSTKLHYLSTMWYYAKSVPNIVKALNNMR
jgi:hypothetical protein